MQEKDVCLPRTRGDIPSLIRFLASDTESSPYARGYTYRNNEPNGPLDAFPVRAGIYPHRLKFHQNPLGLPRTRGDIPIARTALSGWLRSTPYARGYAFQVVRDLFERQEFLVHAGICPHMGVSKV